jgi:hypothetical protein
MLMRHLIALLSAILLATGPLKGGSSSEGKYTAPVERSHFSALTSYDSLQAFLGKIAESPLIHVEKMARSLEGRTVNIVRVAGQESSAPENKVRILLFAQQHGNEPSGKEALTVLLARCASGAFNDLLHHIELLIVPQMNPDGAERRQRRTADSLDLNRSHLLLNSPEVVGLHDLFRAELPEVTEDIDEYTSYIDTTETAGLIKTADVQLGMLTNLNSPAALQRYEHERIYPWIEAAMRGAQYSFHEYLVGSPDQRLRHSTTEPNDGRQSFGLLGTLSFIQEGRRRRTLEEELERRVRSQLCSIEALLHFCGDHASEIRSLVKLVREDLKHAAGREFVLRMDHVRAPETLRIPMYDQHTRHDTLWYVHPYDGMVQASRTTTLPKAYVVPSSEHAVIALLSRHGVQFSIAVADEVLPVEVFHVDSTTTVPLEEEDLSAVAVSIRRTEGHIRKGDVIVPVNQSASLLIGTLLEPESIWGLAKYPAFSELLRRREYPILRIP